MSAGRYLYTGVDTFLDEDYDSQVLLNVTPGPRLDMYIFYCTPVDSDMKPRNKAAIAVAAFLLVVIVVGTLSYLLLAKASKFRRFLVLSAIRIKGPPRSGRMSLVVTDIEGYSGGPSHARGLHEIVSEALCLPILLWLQASRPPP
jgi:hypothetical protein